jgi:hypothetical protein
VFVLSKNIEMSLHAFFIKCHDSFSLFASQHSIKIRKTLHFFKRENKVQECRSKYMRKDYLILRPLNICKNLQTAPSATEFDKNCHRSLKFCLPFHAYLMAFTPPFAGLFISPGASVCPFSTSGHTTPPCFQVVTSLDPLNMLKAICLHIASHVFFRIVVNLAL